MRRISSYNSLSQARQCLRIQVRATQRAVMTSCTTCMVASTGVVDAL